MKNLIWIVWQEEQTEEEIKIYVLKNRGYILKTIGHNYKDVDIDPIQDFYSFSLVLLILICACMWEFTTIPFYYLCSFMFPMP
jgi:hypothetical protein